MRVRAKELQDDTLDDLSDEDLIEYFRDIMMGDPNQPDYAQLYDAQEDDDRRLRGLKANGDINVIDSAGNWIYENWWEAPDELSCIELQRYASVSIITSVIMVLVGPAGAIALGDVKGAITFGTVTRKMAVSTVFGFDMYVI